MLSSAGMLSPVLSGEANLSHWGRGGEEEIGGVVGVKVVNYKKVTGGGRVPTLTGIRTTRVITFYSVVRRHTDGTERTFKASTTGICASCVRLLGGSRVSIVRIYAPGVSRTRVSVTTVRSNGRIVYRGPVTGASRRTRTVVTTVGQAKGGLAVNCRGQFEGSSSCLRGVYRGKRLKSVCGTGTRTVEEQTIPA